jgi:NAD(P)H-nitrite reductase large subunit
MPSLMRNGFGSMSSTAPSTDSVICRCLQVKESQVVDAIAVTGAETIRDVIEQTGAGAGCTACHCRIRELLGCRTAGSTSNASLIRA